ncbi:10342_t:CDS:1, partial [Paraglomus occultum]
TTSKIRQTDKVLGIISRKIAKLVNKDGSATVANGCNALNNPIYLINIPVRDVFYEPPVPAIGYLPLAPPPCIDSY